MFPCGTVRLADSLWYLQKGSWVMWSQQRWCWISLMYQKTWDCGERKVLFTKRHPSSDMCYSFHLPHPPPFILSHRLNPRWERTLSFVYVYNEMPRLPPLLLPRSGSDHGIRLVSGSTGRVRLGSNPSWSQTRSILSLVPQLPHSEQPEIPVCLLSAIFVL